MHATFAFYKPVYVTLHVCVCGGGKGGISGTEVRANVERGSRGFHSGASFLHCRPVNHRYKIARRLMSGPAMDAGACD